MRMIYSGKFGTHRLIAEKDLVANDKVFLKCIKLIRDYRLIPLL